MNFKEIGRNGKVEGFALIKKCEVKTSVKGGKYLDLILSDSDGETVAKFWDYQEGITPDFSENILVKVRGQINEYKGTDQLRVELIREAVPSDNVNINDYVRSSEYNSIDMYNKIIETVHGFKDADLKTLVLTLYEENREKLLYFPAAVRLHHAMRGGLLYHTLSIIEVAKKVCTVYPLVDYDLLITGAALHDIAKTREMNANELGIAGEYTADGNLIGHLVRGAMMVRDCGERLGIPDEKIRLVEHMLLSHHGAPEFGSPVRPMFLEAMILSSLDELDAKIYEVLDVTKDVNSGTFSARQWALSDVRLYNHGRQPDPHPTANII